MICINWTAETSLESELFNQVGAGLLFAPCQYRGLTAVTRHLRGTASLWGILSGSEFRGHFPCHVTGVQVKYSCCGWHIWMFTPGWFQESVFHYSCLSTHFLVVGVNQWNLHLLIRVRRHLFSFCVMFFKSSNFDEINFLWITTNKGDAHRRFDFTSGVHIEYLLRRGSTVIKVFFKCLPINPWQR